MSQDNSGVSGFEEIGWDDDEFTDKKPDFMPPPGEAEEPPDSPDSKTSLSGLQELNSIPTDWTGVSKINKVLKLVSVVQQQIQRVRSGNFDFSRSYRVAALALEGLMELADFFADVESKSKGARSIIDYTESEVSSKLESEHKGDKKLSEMALKRMSLNHPEVKQAKEQFIDMEREFKKWKCVYEILQEAHVFFRGLSKR